MSDDTGKNYVAAALAVNRLDLPQVEVARVAAQFTRLAEFVELVNAAPLSENIDSPLEFKP